MRQVKESFEIWKKRKKKTYWDQGPQSAGVVERTNQTKKDRLNKACMDTGRNWVDLLPAVLAEMRLSSFSTTKMCPFVIIMDRPFPTPWVKGHTVSFSTDGTEVIITVR